MCTIVLSIILSASSVQLKAIGFSYRIGPHRTRSIRLLAEDARLLELCKREAGRLELLELCIGHLAVHDFDAWVCDVDEVPLGSVVEEGVGLEHGHIALSGLEAARRGHRIKVTAADVVARTKSPSHDCIQENLQA